MTLEQLRKFKPQIQALAREYKIDPDSIRVFGSVARGEAEPNDIDLLVHLFPECDLLDFSGFTEEMQMLLCLKVDVVPDESVLPHIMPHALRDAALL